MSFDPVGLLSDHSEPTTVPKTNPWAGKDFRNKTWNQAASAREVSAALAALPAEIQFADDFPEPIRYDSTRRVLLYRGFMTNSSYVELQKLSRNLDYTRALERLFTSSAMDPADQKKSSAGLVAAIIGSGLIVVAIFVWRMMG